MLKILIILTFLFSNILFAAENDCKWTNETPCVIISKSNITNSNKIGDKITPSISITKKQIEKYNLIDFISIRSYRTTRISFF